MKNLLAAAIAASTQACAEILEVYHSGNFQTETKGDNSPLTLADKRAHTAIVEKLKATQLPILSEEGKNIAYAERKTWQRFWLVDPLDGTKEFVKRNGEFTVNIALIENQKPVLGVVAVPVTGEVFYGAHEIGAWLISGEEEKQLFRAQHPDLATSDLRVVASRSHMNEETQQFINTLNNPSLVSAGSSLKFMLLANGKADVYPRFAPTMEWDTAAAHAIVNQVGFSVLQKDTNQELVYNKPDLLNPHFICR